MPLDPSRTILSCPHCRADLDGSDLNQHAADCTAGQAVGRFANALCHGFHWVLDREHKVVPCPDLIYFNLWIHGPSLIVAQNENSLFRVSTVFLGIDLSPVGLHRLRDENEPPRPPAHCFETCLFSRAGGEDIEILALHRCGTWEEAERQHAALVTRMNKSIIAASDFTGFTKN